MLNHDFLSTARDVGGELSSLGYPDECRDFALFADSLAALITDGKWMIQPFTQKMQAIVVDFVSERQSEAEASLPHGWNGAWELPMGAINTVHSRTETNEQNARFARHLCLIGTGFPMRDFYWNVTEKLLDAHSCQDRNCKICTGRFPRDLAYTFTLLADGLNLNTITLFSKWQPGDELLASLAAQGIELRRRPLSDIPQADLEANRHYSIWDGTEERCQDFLQTFWSPSWRASPATKKSIRPPCPRCASDRVVPIAYGLPSVEIGKKAGLGEIAIGGCIPGMTQWACQLCGAEF